MTTKHITHTQDDFEDSRYYYVAETVYEEDVFYTPLLGPDGKELVRARIKLGFDLRKK